MKNSRQHLAWLLGIWIASISVGFGQESAEQARFPAVTSSNAWQSLPRKNPPLPQWARMLVATLPKTTGSMLELNALHRSQNPLGSRLAAMVRWAVAYELACDYSIQYAEADLREAGFSDDDLRQLDGDWAGPRPPNKRRSSLPGR